MMARDCPHHACPRTPARLVSAHGEERPRAGSGNRPRATGLREAPEAHRRFCPGRLTGLILVLLWAGSLPVVRGAMQFTDVTASANILSEHHYAEPPEGIDRYGTMMGGAVAEDFDGDGWMDLYFLKGGDAPNLLYINQQDGTFQDEAAARGAAVTGNHMAVCAADYDSDGDVDIFISAAGEPHLLLVNDGTGSFTVDSTSIVLPGFMGTSPSFGDINNDGLLELAVGAWEASDYNPGENRLQMYRNLGGGQLEPYFSFPNERDFIPYFFDMDGDHWSDLLVVGDFTDNTRWYHNDGRGLFFERGRSDIVNGMGATVGDTDNDGDLDVFMTAIARDNPGPDPNDGNRFLENDGEGNLSDMTDAAGLRDGDWGWGTDMADFDLDGDLDIYMVNGWQHPSITEWIHTPARLFENQGGNVFADIAAASGDAADTGQGRCTVVFDYDNDGDQDIFIVNNSVVNGTYPTWTFDPAPPVLLRNDSVNSHHHLKVLLNGLNPPYHSHGVGARVHVKTGSIEQMRELNASSGFNGHGPKRIAHFGLKDEAVADRIRAVWPTGDVVELRDVAADQTLVITSPEASVSSRSILAGESVSASYPAGLLPPGATATWTVEGVDYPDPLNLTLGTPGEYPFLVEITSGAGGEVFHRAETIMIEVSSVESANKSVAQQWNEENLDAIRRDFPAPTIHARNLLGTSIAMWDAWAAYDPVAVGVLHREAASAGDTEAARHEAISHAAYRVLLGRYGGTINGSMTAVALSNRMEELGYDASNDATVGTAPANLGNRIAETVLSFTDSDGWDDLFLGSPYEAVNDPLQLWLPGTTMMDPNHWQPLEFELAFTQNEQEADLVQSYVGPDWGGVRPFALSSLAPGELLHLDPGPPPMLGTGTDSGFKDGNVQVIEFSGLLDPADGTLVDISPGAIGNNTLGENDGTGHPLNPETGAPYPSNVVNLADFGRVLAEFWADGPDSETPPGHWNTLANELHEHPDFVREFEGAEPELGRLEWDVKVYLALNGAMHDAAIAAWGCKRVYDYVRPISSIRHMGGLGQSTDPSGDSHHPDGLPLVPGLIEVVTAASSAPGERHEHLSAHVGAVAILAWSSGNGVDWMRAVDWLPYQKTTFVTPAFPGYVSGHSTFSRAGAEVLTRMTGSPFFPGGLGTFTALQDEFLQFEVGPTTDIVLQWATYYDAADQAGLSRIYGGIHVPADDGPGRIMGSAVGIGAWDLAAKYFDGSILTEPIRNSIGFNGAANLELNWDSVRGAYYKVEELDGLGPGAASVVQDWFQATESTSSALLPMSGTRGFFRIERSFDSP